MEVTNPNVAHLCNFEVLQLLKELKEGWKKQSKQQARHQHPLATITYETITYLQETPCDIQSSDCIKKFKDAVKPFNLTKEEILMFINHRPRNDIEIQVIVEESEDRLTVEQIQQLLDIVADCLPE